MTRILLDASGYSAFLRGDPGAGDAVCGADEIFLSPTVIGELRAAFAASSRHGEYEAGLAAFLESPRVAVVPLDQDTGRFYAAIASGLRKARRAVPMNVLWIAASAMQHGLVVVTSDPHFTRIPQVICQMLETPAVSLAA